MTLLDAARGAAERLRSTQGDVEIVARSSADGIAAAAALVGGLAACGRAFHVRFSDEAATLALEDGPGPRVLVGIGAGEGLLAIDHRHDGPPRPGLLSGRTLGWPVRDACTATLVLAVSTHLHEAAWAAAPAALAGAWSEGQGRPSFTGWNAQVLEQAKARGHLGSKVGLLFDDRPLLEVLMEKGSAAPALGSEEAASAFLARYGLPRQATIHELGPREAQRFASGLALEHLRGPAPAADIARWFGPVPVDAARGMPLPRLAALLSRAAAHGEAGLGLACLLGDAAALADLEALPPPSPPLLARGPA